jgi:site-specific recombinase XerD
MTTGLENGADLKALMEAGGHKTLAAAELYQSTTRARTINVMEAAIRGKRPQGAQQRGHSESAQTA